MYKHIGTFANVSAKDHLSAEERLQARKNLLDFFHAVHGPQGFYESGAAIVTNSIMVQAGKDIGSKTFQSRVEGMG